MTPAASDEILTSLVTEGERTQDDRLKNSFDGIFMIDPHAALQHQMKMKYIFEN